MTEFLIKEISNPHFWTVLIREKQYKQRLSIEINNTVREMAFALPTARESEVLPYLKIIGEQLAVFFKEQTFMEFFTEIVKEEEVTQMIFEDLFLGTVQALYKGKLYHNLKIVDAADVIFSRLVEGCTQLVICHAQGHDPYVLQLLSTLLDKNADYYKNTGRESMQAYPFGELLLADQQTKTWVDEELREHDLVDVAKSYSNLNIWSRGKRMHCEGMLDKVRYSNDGSLGYLNRKYTELAPYKTRSLDFDWRQQLKEGEWVDLYTNDKEWTLGVILKVELEEIQSQLLFKEESSDEEPMRVKQNNFMEKEEATETIKKITVRKLMESIYQDNIVVLNVHNSCIDKPGRFSLRQRSINDANDRFYSPMDPSKIAVMRHLTSYLTSSALLVKYINIFGTQGGLDHIIQFFSQENQDQLALSYFIRILRHISDFLVEKVMKQHGKFLLFNLINYALNSTKRNLRIISSEQLNSVIFGIESLTKRLLSYFTGEKVLGYVMLNISLICLKSDVLEKQNFALKLFSRIEPKLAKTLQIHSVDMKRAFFEHFNENRKLNLELLEELPVRFLDNDFEQELVDNCGIQEEGLSSKSFVLTKSNVALLMKRQRIFQKIIKGHCSIIQKATPLIKLLFSEGQLEEPDIDLLWDMIVKSEVDTRQQLIKLVKNCVVNMNQFQINMFIDKIRLSAGRNEVFGDALDLISKLRKFSILTSNDDKGQQKINDILWKMINSPGIDPEVFKTSLKKLIEFTVSSYETTVVDKLFNKAVKNIKDYKNVLISIKVLNKIIKVPIQGYIKTLLKSS